MAREGQPVSTSDQIADDILRLDDASFHGFGARQSSAIAARLADLRFEGLAIQAPAELDLARWTSLPVVVASGRTGLRAWEVDFDRNAILVAVNLKSGAILAGPAHPSPEAPSFHDDPPRPRPTRVNATSRSYGAYGFDLRRALDLPWKPGAYAVTLISHDWVSNTVVTRLAARDEPAPAPWLPARAGEAEGIEFTLPSSEASPAAPYPVRAAVRLPLAPRSIVTAPPEHAPGLRALVPATLAVLAMDWQRPSRVDVAIPILGAAPMAPGQIAEGSVTIDLRDRLGAPLSAGSHLLYFIAGRHIVGPKRIAIV